jgi:hypothetical protein
VKDRHKRRGPDFSWGDDAAPAGILDAEFDQLKAAGCVQCEHEDLRPMFIGLIQATKGNVCDGCPAYKGGTCPAFKQYHTGAPRTVVSMPPPKKENVPEDHPLAGLSVKQIAAKLNISIGEVRRRKMAGTL